MSKSSTASAPKTSQLPTQSAWARGPPISSTASSSRSQSPAPSSATVANAPSNAHGSHSRRPSALGSGVSVKDGVNVPVPRSTAGASKSAVTFGSIDDAAAPISSSPASAPPIKSTADGVKTFGSVAVQNGASKAAFTRPSSLSSTSNPSASTSPAPSSTPKSKGFDVSKLFQGPSKTTPTPPSAEASASPSSRPSSLPPAPYAGQPFTPRGQGQNGSNANGPPPRSPSYARPMTNGSGMGARPAAGPGGPSAVPGNIPPAMSSPRLGPHPTPHPGQTPGMPPQTPPVWPGYYYGYAPPPEQYMHSPYAWQQQLPPQHGHPHPPPPHHPPSGPPGPPPPGGGMPMSPRNAPPQLPVQGPGTPTPAHAPLPTPGHTHAASLTSPPSTPSSASGRLSLAASTFVPGKKISIRDPTTGEEANLEALRRAGHVPPRQQSPAPPPTPATKREPKRSSVRIETEEQRQKRLAQEKEKEQKEKEKEDQERRVKEDAEKKVQEKKEKEEREKREKEERAAKDKQEEEERKKRDEEARVRKETEEAERKQKEEAERIRKEEEAKSKLEAEEQAKRAEEDKRKEQEEAKAVESAKAAAAQTAAEKEKEEGEVEDKMPAAEKEKLKPSEKEILRIDTAISEGKKRPGRLDLTSATVGNVSAPPPSALATARIIEDLGRVQYPEGIKSPKVELNVNAPAGKFRYDRDFLMQFMSICKEKPDNLPPLDAIGLEPSDQTFSMSRGGSGRGQRPSMAGPPSASARQASIGLGFLPPSLGKAGGGAFAGMGNFSTAQVSKLSSEERFAMASGSSRSASMGGLAGMPLGGRAPPMVRTSSQGGPGKERERTRSKRSSEKRSDLNRISMGHPSGMGQGMPSMGPPLEPVAPLEASANRWVPTSTKRVAPADQESPEIVDRKVKALLNKLTMERFDSISDQIIQWANKSEKEKDGRTLIQVIRLVFEKATDEATFSEMYARLCRKMMEMISPKVQDDGIRNVEGKPIAGGLLFRKYLLNRCQEDFERGWVQKEATAAAALTKATEDQATKAGKEGKEGKEGEGELYSDEYYAAQKAKRRGLGLIRFIGELFKLQMLTERIMHECIKKLLGNVENPEEEEIESLCKLLTTVGQILDTPKAHAHMDVYFSRMKELCKTGNVNSRMQFMLQDVIELRSRNWIPRTQAAAPTTIAQIHEAAAKEKAAAEHQSYQRQMSMSRGGSRRGGDRGETHIGPDGWAVAGTAPRAPPKAGDLSHFGKIAKPAPMTFGPSSVFAGKKDGKAGPSGRETPISRTASTSNMFSMLSGHPEVPVESKPSRPPSRKPSVDLGQAGVPEPPKERRKLQLLPRSKPVGTKDETAVSSEAASDEEHVDDEVPAMSEADALKKIGEDTKEFFSIRSLDEAENYFSTLPQEHRFRLVEKLSMQAVESKEADAQLVADFFTRAREKSLATPAAFEEGLMPLAEIIDDVAIDAPKALDFFAIMLKGAGLHEDEERRARIAAKSMDSDKLLALLT